MNKRDNYPVGRENEEHCNSGMQKQLENKVKKID